MIPLMKSAFLHEKETKEELAQFIINSDKLSMGDKCAEFEDEFAKYQGCKDAVLFNSGGSANLAMIQALKNFGLLQDRDKVGFSALTWSTNVMPIIQLGMIPVPVDVSVSTLNCMSEDILECIKNERIQAMFLTNALGFCGDLPEIKKVCDEENVILIEDNCEALGTEIGGNKTGTFGLCSSHSFFVAHHLSTVEGGMVCTNQPEFGHMLRIVRANGWDRNLSQPIQEHLRNTHGIKSEFDAKYTFYDLGYNLRPTEITGFLGLSQLKHLKENVDRREKIYLELETSCCNNFFMTPMNHDHITKLSAFSFPVIMNNAMTRDLQMQKFVDAGVEIRPVIAGDIQKQPFYKKYVHTKYSLPNAERIDKCGFYCGAYPELDENDLTVIKECLRQCE